MLRTNSKKAIENIRNYIVKIYEPEDYSNCGIDTNKETFEDIKEVIKEIFEIELGHFRSRQIGQYNAFFEWCQGLPSIIDTCYYYNRSAVKDLGNILEETEEERNKYTEEQAEEILTHLIYREIFK